MKTRMKFLDYTLFTILAGISTTAVAETIPYNCVNTAECLVEDEELFSVKTKVREDGVSQRNVITLPKNGMIWATEDSNLGQAELSISAPSYIPFSGGKIVKPITFYIRSNYSAFVTRYEISIYRGTDTDLVEPLTVIPVDVNAISSITWDGTLPEKYRYRNDDNLIYVLRAYDNDDHFDETYAQTIKLVTPEEDDRGNISIQDSISSIKGQSMTQEEALAESLIDEVVSSNNLYRQNIPFVGSRVRIQGSNIPDGSVYIDGESYPVDLQRKFSADFLLPIGKRQFAITVDSKETGRIEGLIDVDVSGNSFFMVGMADLTVFQNKASGPGKNTALTDDDGNVNDKRVVSEGRLAFYMKRKIDGRYTITAHADTKEKELPYLFSGFLRAYPDDVFRSLDPDLYYPTYGDDSSVYRDVDTMGRLYARVDWDKSQALWGNYNTGITGTEYGRYSRSLYGGALDWRSMDNTKYGDVKTQIRGFGSEAQSSPGHTEFLGTGGSLYYLKHTRIVSGSDKVQVEVRDKLTNRVEATITLSRNVDYEIDAVQGRIILTRPLTQIINQSVSSIISESALNGYEQRLIVDYEFVPTGFEPESIIAGFRGKHWITDNIAVGGTYVDENQAGSDYLMKGVDVTLKAGNGTYLKGEYTKTESYGVPIYYSENGGLSFTTSNRIDAKRSGEAKAIEGRVNLKEQGITDRDISAGAWWHKVDAGYSSSSNDYTEDNRQYGAEVSAEVIEHVQAYARHTKATNGNNSYEQSQLTSEWRMNDESTLTGEFKRVVTKSNKIRAVGMLAGAKYSWRYDSSWEFYGAAQVTLDDDNGEYENNDSVTAGLKYYYGDLSSVGLEASTGHRGQSVLASIEHKINSDHSVYANYTLADNSDYNSVFNSSTGGWTVGQRWRLSNKVNIFNETQQLKGNGSERGLANTVGMDYLFDKGWSSSFTVQDGKLKTSSSDYQDSIHRIALSASLTRTTKDMDWTSKLEYRRDTGAEHRRQWLTTNRGDVKVNESLRLSAKFNYSKTYDFVTESNEAKFIESAIGFAWRPWDSNQWALFGRYNFFYDESSVGQDSDGYDQRSHIFSLEGVYKHNAEWEFAGKLAYRRGEKRYDYLDEWFDSSAMFSAMQFRYEVIRKWHLLGEYRWLKVKDGGLKQGVLVGFDRDLTDNLRLGIGYNFTDFSDDLTKQDYRYRGVFVNFVGYY